MLLADAAYQARPADRYTLVPPTGHVLWETASFSHCSCPAAWREYRAILEQVPDEDWLRDSTGTVRLWFDCAHWRAVRDAASRVYLYLRQHDLPLADATVTSPVIQQRTLTTDVPLLRAKAPLVVTVRLDHEANDCLVEFEAGPAQPILPGALVLSSGCRRQRIRGAATLLQFLVHVPHAARSAAFVERSLHDPAVLDTTVFSAATALPVSEPLPPAPLLLEKLEWLQSRSRRRHRHTRCPAVRRFLRENQDPESATPEDVQLVLQHAALPADAVFASQVLESVPVLTPDQCETLRRFAEDHMTSIAPDTVDDAPEYQVNLSEGLLTQLLGEATARRLLDLPARYPEAPAMGRVEIFLRMYSLDMRPYIAFHSDNCTLTANVALNQDQEFDGGKLVTIQDGRLTVIPRERGTALIHCSQLVHGVSQITRGVRHTLILFFYAADSAV